MTEQYSYTKIEKPLFQELKKDLMLAESTEDVKKFFVRCIQKLIYQVTDKVVEANFEDIELSPKFSKHYKLSERISKKPEFVSKWKNSDLSRIFQRMADTAIHRFEHLQKYPDKTESKMFHGPGESF